MTDILGPGSNTTNVVTTRPADTRIMGVTDTWFKDCTSPANNDGTRVPAGFLNSLVANLRSLVRNSGLADDSTDDLLWRAQAKTVQTGKLNYAAAVGGSANDLTVTLSPAPSALVAGMEITFKIATANTGAMTLNVNGLGIVSARDLNGALFSGGEFAAGQIPTFRFDGTYWRAVAGASIATLAALSASKGTASLASAGALDMANGLQIRWGGVAGSTTGTFHHAFSNGAFAAVATCYSGNTAGPDIVEVSGITATAVNVVTSRADTNATYTTGTWWYIAIGY